MSGPAVDALPLRPRNPIETLESSIAAVDQNFIDTGDAAVGTVNPDLMLDLIGASKQFVGARDWPVQRSRGVPIAFAPRRFSPLQFA
jgi:hypothetical protein